MSEFVGNSSNSKETQNKSVVSDISKDMEPSTTDSVHLKLYEITSNEVSARDKVEEKNIHLREFFSGPSHEVLAVSTCEKWNLEQFFKHLIGKKPSEDNDIHYRERFVNPEDTLEYEKYLKLFEEGKFMTGSKKFSSQWRPASAPPPTTQVKEFLDNNIKRIKGIAKDEKTVPIVLEFLKNQFIEGEKWDFYRKNDSLSTAEVLKNLKQFLTWLRREFPYYYNECGFCKNRDENCYLGTVHSTPEELGWDSSRTELYYCGKCQEVTRFPRYNVMEKVLETHKGRCGEYSVLLLQMLRALDYNARWVVDREDHVWAEVEIEGIWYHCDPCEAAINEPLLYQGWGKKQTYIFAFSFDNVEDVTNLYTTDYEGVLERRKNENASEEYIKQIFEDARKTLLII